MKILNTKNGMQWLIKLGEASYEPTVNFVASAVIRGIINQLDNHYVIRVMNFNTMFSCAIEGKFENNMLLDYLNIFEKLNKHSVADIYNIFKNREDVMWIEFRVDKLK